MEDILVLENVKKEYGNKDSKMQALKGISFNVKAGEFVGIMGASGAGKSTLLNIVSTIDVQTSGKVFVNNIDFRKLTQNQIADFRRDNLGFVFQNSNLLDTLTLKENIILPLALKNNTWDSIEKRLMDVSSKLGIENILDKYPTEVSGGQKQKAAVCRAIISNPTLILADEPTGALDSKSAKSLLESFLKLNKENNATILMVTHNPVSASFCDRILFIKDGIIFTEIVKGDGRKDFYYKILNTIAVLEGCDINEFV